MRTANPRPVNAPLSLVLFVEQDFDQLIGWIDSASLCYLWGGPNYSYPLTHNQLAKHCQQPQVFPYLLMVAEQPVGFIELYQVSALEWRICRVFIHPAYRGQHLAHQMLELVIEKAREFRAKLLSLGVFSHNHAALSCYKKHGFSVSQRELVDGLVAGEQWELLGMERWLL